MERTIRLVKFPAPKELNVLRVAAYARVSSGKDAMLHSLSAQISYYSETIQRHPGWVYCGVFYDEAITGTKEDRDGFQRLLASCQRREIDMVITKSISRFARNTVTLLEKVRELKELGVDVFFEEQNIHTLSANGELMLTILASYAQEESRSASENAKWRIRKGFENGELINWRFLFGYKIERGEIEVDPETAPFVREVFDKAIAGDSLTAIARYLNDQKARCVRGGEWNASRIREILANEKYIGDALLQKHYVNNHLEKKHLKNNGVLPQYYASGTHEAIIDRETFALAQKRLKEIEKKANTSPKQTSVFTSKIVCGRCGKSYQRITNWKRPAWNCITYTKKGKHSCPGGQIREDILRSVCADVLGLATFDEDAFTERVQSIRMEQDQVIVFRFTDGSEESRRWEKHSRADSWTPDMKQAARASALLRRKQP